MISTCANCLSASEHNGEIKINFCFHCGYQVNYQHREKLKIHDSKTAYDQMMKQLDSIQKSIKAEMVTTKPKPNPKAIDWDLELSKMKRSK